MENTIFLDQGRAAAANVAAGGFLISLKTFDVTEASGWALDPAREELVGTPVYSGSIDAVEIISKGLVRFTLSIPKGTPAGSSWELNEIGIRDSDGLLMIHGKIQSYPKTPAYGLKMYVYCLLGRLTDFLNITLSEAHSLPSVATVDTLLAPASSSQNVVAVLDQNLGVLEYQTTGDPNITGGALAVKSGPGGSMWSFVGHTRVFRGYPENVSDLESFGLDAPANGFWADAGEIMIVQIVLGPGAGATRKMFYSKSSKRFFTLDTDFTELTTASQVAIWKSDAWSIPERASTLPEFSVLGFGRNDFAKVTTATTAGYFEPYEVEITGNGGSTYPIDSNVPLSALSDKDRAFVSVDNVLISQEGYNFSGQNIVFEENVAGGATIYIRVFDFVLSSTQGGYLYFQETLYTQDASNSYQLPSVPLSKKYVFVFVNNELQAPSAYSVTDSILSFTVNFLPVTNDTIIILTYSNQEDSISFTKAVRNTYTTFVGGTYSAFASDALITDKKNTLLYVDGIYVPKDSYTIESNSSVVLNTPITGAHYVDLTNFTSDVGSEGISVSGRNEGPAWVDPAGVEGFPNKLVPYRFRYIGNGTTDTYPAILVPDKTYTLVFVSGKRILPSEYTVNTVSGAITLTTPPEDGDLIDIISFNEIRYEGSQGVFQVFPFQGNNTRDYTIQTGADPNALLIFISNGFTSTFIHKDQYTYVPNTGALSFNFDIETQSIEAWNYYAADLEGYRTQIASEVFTRENGRLQYSLEETLSSSSASLAFIEGFFLDHSLYTLTAQTNTNALQFYQDDEEFEDGNVVSVLEFVSFPPRTRLLLRKELITRYLSRDANLWDLSDKVEARRALGLNDIGFLTSVNNLSDVADAETARINLGIPQAIAAALLLHVQEVNPHEQYIRDEDLDLPSILLEARKRAYPVGTIFESNLSTNPNILLGFGTWTSITPAHSGKYSWQRAVEAVPTGYGSGFSTPPNGSLT